MATEESLIVGVVLVVLGVISAVYGTILCFTTKVQPNNFFFNLPGAKFGLKVDLRYNSQKKSVASANSLSII